MGPLERVRRYRAAERVHRREMLGLPWPAGGVPLRPMRRVWPDVLLLVLMAASLGWYVADSWVDLSDAAAQVRDLLKP